MQVSVKSFDVQMELKNKGVELEIRDNDGKHLGDLVVTKTKLIWCRRRTRRVNGIDATWPVFIRWMEEE